MRELVFRGDPPRRRAAGQRARGADRLGRRTAGAGRRCSTARRTARRRSAGRDRSPPAGIAPAWLAERSIRVGARRTAGPARARAARPAGQPAEGDARRGAAGSLPMRRRRRSRRSACGCPKASGSRQPHAWRQGLVEVQDEGSQLHRARLRRRAGHDRRRSLRRRRRQDAGACGARWRTRAG